MIFYTVAMIPVRMAHAFSQVELLGEVLGTSGGHGVRLCVLGATRQASPWHSLSRCSSIAHRWQWVLSWGSRSVLLVWKQELWQGFLTLPRHWRSRVANISHLVRETGKLWKLHFFVSFPAVCPCPSVKPVLTTWVVPGVQRCCFYPRDLCGMCPFTQFDGLQENSPVAWGNITQSRASTALFSCGPADLLELWVPEEFTSEHLKKPNCFGNNVTEVSPYMLGCCM